MRGLIVAAAASHSGKTMLALALMAALRQQGVRVVGGKVGPDYIDPGFHQLASGSPSLNLDPFAMSSAMLKRLAYGDADLRSIEGAMGVCDGGEASTANLAARLDVPVVLVLDVAGQGETAAIIAQGIQHALAQKGVELAGVILNRYASPRHYRLIAEAMGAAGVVLFGGLPRCDGLAIASRHLGLKQASELDHTAMLATAAKLASQHIDLDELLAAAKPILPPPSETTARLFPPLGQRIAVASDDGFRFAYPHILAEWRQAGAEIVPFSPLADAPPDKQADAVYLPGGYPELYLPKLAGNTRFLSGVREAATRRAWVYGECGGYMVLGEAITDQHGATYPMAGLLDCTTSFAQPKLHLGYQRLSLVGGDDLPLPTSLIAHEFHYTQATREHGTPLFLATGRGDTQATRIGLRHGSVFGSYAHIISTACQS